MVKTGKGLIPLCISFLLIWLLPADVNSKLSPEDISAITATGLIPLTDEQSGEYAARDYLVINKMYIMRFDTVKFAPGSRIFFHPYSRIHVHGALLFNGTKDKPITIGKLPFSIPSLTTPMQKILDDVSISVYKDAHLTMKHTILLDTFTNINFTEKTSTFVIDSLKCAGNKLSIADTVLFLNKDIVFSASREDQKLNLPLLSSLNSNLDYKNGIQKKRVPILPFQILFGAEVLATAGIAIYSHTKLDYFYQRYPAEKDPDMVKWCREEYYKYQKYRNGAIVGSILGSFLFTATFFINIK